MHAYANSRIGFKSILTIRRLSADVSSVSDSIMVIDGNKTAPELLTTIEGPKLYKKGSFYFILAPAGGVASGWQMALRATKITGPWEYKKVMEQGNTSINGPHQGGWVTTPDEKQSWFVHFQDKGAYGRVVHLQPMTWVDDWPVIGTDGNRNGCGNPVLTYAKPAVGGNGTIDTASDLTALNNLLKQSGARVIFVKGTISGKVSIGADDKSVLGLPGAKIYGSLEVTNRKNVIVSATWSSKGFPAQAMMSARAATFVRLSNYLTYREEESESLDQRGRVTKLLAAYRVDHCTNCCFGLKTMIYPGNYRLWINNPVIIKKRHNNYYDIIL